MCGLRFLFLCVCTRMRTYTFVCSVLVVLLAVSAVVSVDGFDEDDDESFDMDGLLDTLQSTQPSQVTYTKL